LRVSAVVNRQEGVNNSLAMDKPFFCQGIVRIT